MMRSLVLATVTASAAASPSDRGLSNVRSSATVPSPPTTSSASRPGVERAEAAATSSGASGPGTSGTPCPPCPPGTPGTSVQGTCVTDASSDGPSLPASAAGWGCSVGMVRSSIALCDWLLFVTGSNFSGSGFMLWMATSSWAVAPDIVALFCRKSLHDELAAKRQNLRQKAETCGRASACSAQATQAGPIDNPRADPVPWLCAIFGVCHTPARPMRRSMKTR